MGAKRWVAALALVVACGGGEGSEPVRPEPTAAPPAPAPEPAPDRTTAPETTVPQPTAPETTAPEPAPAIEPAPEPAIPPAPAVTVALDEDELPIPVPELRDADRLGEGPALDDRDLAIGAGVLDFASGEAVEILAEIEHRRRLYALVTMPSRRPRSRGRPEYPEMRSVHLVRLEARTANDPDTGEAATTYRRHSAVRLYDGAFASEAVDSEDACRVASELRARDVDGDGEVELTAIAAVYRPAAEPDQECGAVAFLVGGDDLGIQARFTREYLFGRSDAGGDTTERRDTTWQLRDLDGDGHADLHVIETWRYRDDFMGDDIGEDESAPAEHARGSDRRELDCLWAADADAWRCPGDPQPGLALFLDGAERAPGRSRPPWPPVPTPPPAP